VYLHVVSRHGYVQATESLHEVSAAMGGFFLRHHAAVTAPFVDAFFAEVRCLYLCVCLCV
jgi:hypothetical protein